MNSNLPLHLKYIIFILALIIIALITKDFGANKEIVSYLTFGLTISSILLALITIFYTMFTSSSAANSITQLASTSSDLRKSSLSIIESNKNLQATIETLPDQLSHIETDVKHTRSIMEEMNTSGTSSVESSRESVGDSEKTEISREFVKNFLTLSPIRGCEALLAAVLSARTGKGYNESELQETYNEMNDDDTKIIPYMHGYRLASKSAGLFESKYKKELIITAVANKHLDELIEESLHQKLTAASLDLEGIDKKNEFEVSEYKKNWMGGSDYIYKYFEVSPYRHD